MNSNRRRNTSIATMMLLYQLFITANESSVPPVTLFLIGGQIMIFLGILQLPFNSPADICMSVDKIWYWKDYKRLFFAAFEHSDDYHLYYNMMSLMWKGKTLESVYGPGYFAFMITIFTGLTNVTYLFLNYALSILLMDQSFIYSCAVGFSGTLFALKVVTTSLLETTYGSSMSFANKWGVWVELLYISFITPNASFVGHLAGILVGLFYVQGPLKPLMRGVWTLIDSTWKAFNPPNPNQRNDNEYYDESERFRREQQRRYQQNHDFRRRPGFGMF